MKDGGQCGVWPLCDAQDDLRAFAQARKPILADSDKEHAQSNMRAQRQRKERFALPVVLPGVGQGNGDERSERHENWQMPSDALGVNARIAPGTHPLTTLVFALMALRR